MPRQLVFDHAANPYADDPIYKLSEGRAKDMIVAGEAFRVFHPITGIADPRRIQKFAQRDMSEEDLAELGGASDTSLTESDSACNVGATDTPVTDKLVPVYAIRNGRQRRVGMEQPAVAQARNRVNFWPIEHDRKAVYVPARSQAQPDRHGRGSARRPVTGGLLALSGSPR